MGDDAEVLREYARTRRQECLAGGEGRPEGHCARVFDGILCWEAAEPGSLARQECPDDFIYSSVKVNWTLS